VVVYGHRKDFLGFGLADDVPIQNLADIFGLRKLAFGFSRLGPLLDLFPDDIVAQLNAFVTNEHGRPRNQLTDLMLTLAAKRAIQEFFALTVVFVFCHIRSSTPVKPKRCSLG
jgi:hypothetical protein